MTPETPTERTAVVASRLAIGRTMTIGEIMGATGLTRAGAYNLMYRISRVQPLVLFDGRWQYLVSVSGVDTFTR